MATFLAAMGTSVIYSWSARNRCENEVLFGESLKKIYLCSPIKKKVSLVGWVSGLNHQFAKLTYG